MNCRGYTQVDEMSEMEFRVCVWVRMNEGCKGVDGGGGCLWSWIVVQAKLNAIRCVLDQREKGEKAVAW